LVSPYIAHFPLIVFSDYYLWNIGKKIVGKSATRVAFILILTSTFMTEFEIRCFTNTLEKVCTVVSFHFYMEQKDKFDSNTIIFTFLLTIEFMMRNTSPVAWIPLIMIKIFRDNSFMPFLISGLLIAIPTIFLCVYLDSLYYYGAKTDS
jgi:hypothetical protein